MSTEKKRPQLEPDELQQLKWLLGGVLALVAIFSLLYLDVGSRGGLIAALVLIPAVLLKPALPARVPRWAHRLAFPAIVAFFAGDLVLQGQFLPAIVRLDTILLLYRACSYRKRRDELQLIVLGLFLVVAAGVITVSMAFAVQIVAFTSGALMLLLLVTLTDTESRVEDASATSGVPAWTRVSWRRLLRRLGETCDWRVFALGGTLFAALVILSGLLFLAIPRFQLESSMFLERLLAKKESTGFTDVLEFGEVSSIQQDTSVAFRVEVSDRNEVSGALYWRMVVLDEYRDRAFRLSKELQASAFHREQTALRIGGGEQTRGPRWTFYFEPGVSRYLPIGGGFRRLAFTEPQSFRASSSLGLVMLSRDPFSMKAYRIEGMRTDGVLRAHAANLELPTLRALPVGESDRVLLRDAVREITRGEMLGAEAFARAAVIWLARRHEYSLASELPKGAGDPVVRWLVSEEPGHCELFAGAFALLARTAGHPTRLVAGFLGGTWNDDYLMVRNSDAHAWCEIYDGENRWLRVDPTNDGRLLLSGRESGGGAANPRLRTTGGWSGRLDRLRFLWYRRIVNFDQGDQFELMRAVKDKARSSGQEIRAWAEHVVSTIRMWLAKPWNVRRFAMAIGWIGAAALAIWLVRKAGAWGWRRIFVRRGAVDPVRREAGRWLVRLRGAGAGEDVLGELERLRYGSRESWPEPREVFGRARAACRACRKTTSKRV